ncbi:MAG: hypothetical protein ACYTG7_16625 [Planctomycetota bacterium]|jgi:hypothetical protein
METGAKLWRSIRLLLKGDKFRWLLFFLFLLPFEPLLAQSWNRAVFRDDEKEPRDFSYNDEYFLNLHSYQPAPDWESMWESGERGYLISLGSVRSDEFYLRQEVKFHGPISESFGFHFDLLQDEDFDTRFLRNRVAVTFTPHEEWTIYALGEGTAAKEDNDIGIGTIHSSDALGMWEVQLTAVDFNEDKGQQGREFRDDAYGLLVKNRISLSENLSLGGGIDYQLPMTLVEPVETLKFRFDKRQYHGWLRWRTGDESSLRLAVKGEVTSKNTQYQRPAPPSDQRLNRNAFKSNMEFMWLWEQFYDARCYLGFQYFHYWERSRFPEQQQDSIKEERDEFTFYGGPSIEIHEQVFFKPTFFLDYVSRNLLLLADPSRNDRYNGFQGKLSGIFELRFKDTVRLVIHPALDLDKMNWGGGNIQFIAFF